MLGLQQEDIDSNILCNMGEEQETTSTPESSSSLDVFTIKRFLLLDDGTWMLELPSFTPTKLQVPALPSGDTLGYAMFLEEGDGRACRG